MKVSEGFKKAINDFIEKEKLENPDFLEATKKEDRNLEDCCNYILNTVQELGHNAMADDEVFDLVSKYFFAEKIEKPKPVAAKVEVSKPKAESNPAVTKEPVSPKPKTPAELLAEEGITEELLATMNTKNYGSKIILQPGMPVYSLLKTKDHFFVYDENNNIVKDEKMNNKKINHKEGMIALARYVLSKK